MTKLSELRARLGDLRRRRQTVRWGTAYAALALAVLWTLSATFLADWLFSMSKPQRLLLLAVGAGVVVWAFRRYTKPWLGHKESELDIALLVERQQKIDSDLVAAIQFESPEAAKWGSSQLEGAVIDYVGEFGKGWNILEGFSKQDLVRRAGALTATVMLLGIAIAAFPGYATAFLNRMLLGSAHYPTRTQINLLLVNGQEVEPFPLRSVIVQSPYGKPLTIEVHSAGELPEQGRVDLQATSGGAKTSLDLVRASDKDAAVSALKPGEVVYIANLPKLVDSVAYELFLGDAWTDPQDIRLIELPKIDTHLDPTPPPYAHNVELPPEAAPGLRQISVIEGSSVGLQVTCHNKALTKATLVVEGAAYPLEEAAKDGGKANGRLWVLTAKDTPLARVAKPLHYEIQVLDEDGMQLESPVQGFIRIKADQRPRISADVVTRHVLPTASPLIEYRASDDYGIAKLLVHLQVTHGEGSSAENKPEEFAPREIKPLPNPILRDQLPAGGIGSYALDLSSLKVAKGDTVRVTLEVVDYRGPVEGLSASSEPLVLQVTDESGVLAAISESDERSARQLDAIIKRQLGIGESK